MLTPALCLPLLEWPVVGVVMKFPPAPGAVTSTMSAPVAGQHREIELVTVSGPWELTPSHVSAIALDFKVLHPVVITRLGVFPSGPWPELRGNVTVKLLQLDQEVTATPTRTRLTLVWRCCSFHCLTDR